MIVPGGGLSLDGKKWLASRPGFFLPVRVLSRLFRRLFSKCSLTRTPPAASRSSATMPHSPPPQHSPPC
jgi:hypothetical protein